MQGTKKIQKIHKVESHNFYSSDNNVKGKCKVTPKQAYVALRGPGG
jgi:hypothetical protein